MYFVGRLLEGNVYEINLELLEHGVALLVESYMHAGSAEHHLLCYNPATGKLLAKRALPTAIAQNLTASPSRSITVASFEGVITSWSLPHLEQLWTVAAHSSTITGLCFALHDTLLASSAADGSIRLWDPASGREVGLLDLGYEPQQITDMSTACGSGTLVFSDWKDNLCAWNLLRQQVSLAWPSEDQNIACFATQPSSDLALVAYEFDLVALNIRKGKELGRVTLDAEVSTCRLSPCGTRALVADRLGAVHILDLAGASSGGLNKPQKARARASEEESFSGVGGRAHRC